MKPIKIYNEEVSVEKSATSILFTYGNGEFMNFPEFQEFLEHTPGFFQIFEDTFNKNLLKLNPAITQNESTIKTIIKISQYSGKIYTKLENKFTSKFGILQNKLLLLFHSISSKNPYDIIFMQNCYVEHFEESHESSKCGIKITHENNAFGEMKF